MVTNMADSIAHEGRIAQILVADDEAYVRHLVRRVLGKLPCELTEVESYDQAVELVEQDPHAFDVLVMDISMPGMKSEEALTRIRGCGCSSRILLSSGLPIDQRIQKLLNMGEAELLSKPYNLSSLGETVKRMMPKGETS